MIQILQGDWVERLRELPEASVHCCVTSPPYWALRDYGTAKWIGGRDDCQHEASDRYYTEQTAAQSSTEAFSQPGKANADRIKKGRWRESGHCVKCGAVKEDLQLGLEKSPQEYVAKLVAGFKEVWRVLRNDGTLWLNMGDVYATGTNGDRKPTQTGKHGYWENPNISKRVKGTDVGLKAKDLVGLPWMVAFALRSDGWYLRSDIIWHKPNPMPESVTDRPTKAHEYIFLMSKRPKYYYDAEAIKEPSSPNSHARIAQENFWNQQGGDKDYRNGVNGNRSMRNTLENWARKANGKNSPMVVERAAGREDSKPNPSRSHVPGVGPKSAPAGSGIKNNESMAAALVHMLPDRNKRTVWTVATAPYHEAHFATFPPDLIKPCIMAGCPAGGTVLDPFAGSGTTGQVALELGRKAILIELNPKYVEMIRQRTNVTPGLALA